MAFGRAQMRAVGGVVGQQTLFCARRTVVGVAVVLVGVMAFGWDAAG